METPDWTDAMAKLERAQQRAKELLSQTETWVADHRQYLGEPLTGTWDEVEQEFVFEARAFSESAPPIWAHELGDIVVALRSVLDYAAWAMVAAGQSPQALQDKRARSIQFPIITGSDRQGAHDTTTLPQRQFRSRLPGVEDPRLLDVVDKFQPFHAGESANLHGLGVLVAMSNREKHRSLHVLSAGNFGVRLPCNPLDPFVLLRDAEIGCGSNRRLAATFVMGQHFHSNGVTYRIGGRRTGPHPYARARFESELTLVVDTAEREPFDDVVLLLVEVVTSLMHELSLP